MADPRASLLRARWLFPVDQPPIENGVVKTVGETIAAVRPYRPGDQVTDLGDVALLPGLVNAHTHLEFSDLPQPLGIPQMAFPDWVRLVIEQRRSRNDTGNRQLGTTQDSGAIARGLLESAQVGVQLLGDIATNDSPAAVPSPGIHPVVFRELLGLARDRIEPMLQIAASHLSSDETGQSLGLSPHATYTVHPELLDRVCKLSSQRSFPVAMHVAESLDEIELLQSGSGRLVELLDSLNAFPRNVIARDTRPLTYLQSLSQAARALVIHGNYLADDELQYLGERSDHMSVVYCPRTHAYFNSGQYPLAEMLAANVNVCLGTDSRASNPDLNLFAEMKFVAEHHPAVSPEGVLYLGTQAGADAVGLGSRFGSISPGKSARLAVVSLTAATADDPHELLFAAAASTRPYQAV